MSDEQAGAAAAVAPEATPESSPAPESTPEATPEEQTRTKPKSARETAREFMRARAQGVRDAKGRLHKPGGSPEGGQFDRETKGDPEPDKEPAEGDPPPADAESGEKADADSSAAAEPAEGLVRIDLPEGHPLTEQGRTFIDMPAETEEASRALVNSWTRRSDVERANTAAREQAAEVTRLRRQVARLEAEAELRTSGELDKAVDPELQNLLAQAQQHGTPEQVEAIQKAIDDQRQRLIDATGAQAEQAAQDQEAGAEFLRGLWAESPRLYSYWFNQGPEAFKAKVAPIIGAYGRHVDERMARGGQGPDLREFFGQWLDPSYAQDPQVVAAIQEYRRQEHERVRQDGVQEGRQAREKELRDQRRETADRHSRRPPTAPARAQRQGRAAGESDDESLRNAKPGQRHRRFRNAARSLGRAFGAAQRGR